ncbi:ABC transporter permease [Sutcliffiella horikoshii]|uniref:ABC transporter permease n=1 Tax=Sutcliffiella horikoshii TaxID=79883 RepID=UPI00384D6562
MMFVFQIIKELSGNLHLIFRLASYDVKSRYQMHYLGILWQLISPAAQVIIFWFVFGLGIRGGAPIGDTPFFVWLIIGLIPWFFISSTIVQGSNSVYAKINIVSKMKFPVSALPMITIVSNGFNLIIMLIILFAVLLAYNIYPNIYFIQFPYYLICLFIFLYAFALLSSTITIMIRDFQLALQSFIRMLFFLTPIFWDPSSLSETWQKILQLNPFYYIILGFRNTLIFNEWFFEDISYLVYFWGITLIMLLIGSFIHIRFRNKFVDYL